MLSCSDSSFLFISEKWDNALTMLEVLEVEDFMVRTVNANGEKKETKTKNELDKVLCRWLRACPVLECSVLLWHAAQSMILSITVIWSAAIPLLLWILESRDPWRDISKGICFLERHFCRNVSIKIWLAHHLLMVANVTCSLSNSGKYSVIPTTSLQLI